MRKPTFCICENKDADQLRSNCAADQRLCFCYMDSTIPLLSNSKMSSLSTSSVAVQPDLRPTWAAHISIVSDIKIYVSSSAEEINCRDNSHIYATDV